MLSIILSPKQYQVSYKYCHAYCIYIKSLKIPKGESEAVYRRTDNTMKRERRETMINKTLHSKL